MGDDVERLNALTEAAAEGKTNDVIKLLEDGIPINGRDGNSNHRDSVTRASWMHNRIAYRSCLRST